MAKAISSADRLDRTPLHQQLAERLRDLIVEGQLSPGSKIAEAEMCTRFGVSRTPLREALRVLSSEGVVTLSPNRGAWVAPFDVAALAYALPVVGALEALAGKLAAKSATDKEIVAISKLHAAMIGHYKAGQMASYFRANRDIHFAIVEATRNPVLVAQYRHLSARFFAARFLADMSPDRWQSAIKDHDRILQTLRARDGEALANVLVRHLEAKFDTVRDWAAREP